MFPKSARHPDIATQADNWSVLGHYINVHDRSRISDVPQLGEIESRVTTELDIEYSQQIGEIVGANAIRCLAKGYEALDAMARCASNGINLSAMTQGYDASVFVARGFCMLMGFSPLDRSSSITVDAFPDAYRNTRSRSRLSRLNDVAVLYKYRRWGHDEVWALTERLINTIKVPTNLERIRSWLRRAKLGDSSKLRNSFRYDDRLLSPLQDSRFNDFPDVVNDRILDEDAPVDGSHQIFVAIHVVQICMYVLRRSRLIDKLNDLACSRRMAIIDSIEKRTLY